jgi:hypothetical protein
MFNTTYVDIRKVRPSGAEITWTDSGFVDICTYVMTMPSCTCMNTFEKR